MFSLQIGVSDCTQVKVTESTCVLCSVLALWRQQVNLQPLLRHPHVITSADLYERIEAFLLQFLKLNGINRNKSPPPTHTHIHQALG